MNATAINPRAVIGGNNPPEPTAIERAEPSIEALRDFLNANPVVSTEDEARTGKSALDNAAAAFKSMEAERKSKVDPLNAEVKTINLEYFRLHNADKKTGIWDKIFADARRRISDYALELERQRFQAEEAARRIAEEASRLAQEAADREREAREEAAAGTCDVSLDAAIETADTLSQQAIRARWNVQRTEAQTKVRITGGSGRAISLQDHETLTLTDWKAAIEDVGVTDEIADAIVKAARAYRKENGKLPRGVEVIVHRGL